LQKHLDFQFFKNCPLLVPIRGLPLLIFRSFFAASKFWYRLGTFRTVKFNLNLYWIQLRKKSIFVAVKLHDRPYCWDDRLKRVTANPTRSFTGQLILYPFVTIIIIKKMIFVTFWRSTMHFY